MMPEHEPGASPPTDQPTTKPTASAVGSFVLPEGEPAPDFSVTDLSGRPVTLASLRHRPTVLIFGSHSLPAFRERAPAINRLRDDLGTRGQVYVIYTREAHAAGEWEISRNREDGVSIPQHPTAEERLAAARRAVKELKLSVPVLVDSIDDQALRAYGNHPAAAVLVGPERKILLYQKHFDPYAMRRAADQAR